jgi:hypothetical protein
MKVERSRVASLMADAQHAMLTLDEFTRRDGSGAMSAAVRDGMRVYSLLLDYRQTERMSADDSSRVQTAIDLIRARLRFLGEVV